MLSDGHAGIHVPVARLGIFVALEVDGHLWILEQTWLGWGQNSNLRKGVEMIANISVSCSY